VFYAFFGWRDFRTMAFTLGAGLFFLFSLGGATRGSSEPSMDILVEISGTFFLKID